MKVICAGMEKTGTTTMAKALRTLGFTTYDFPEHLQYHMDEWTGLYRDGHQPDFLTMYSNVDAVTDQPPCYFWQEILEAFPDSKVVLLVRDSDDVWANSLVRFVKVNKSYSPLFWFASPMVWKIYCILNGSALIAGRNLHVDSKDSYLLKKKYREHNSLVKALVPKEKLLVFNVKEGWKPLCDFLGCEVPDCPFPRENVTGVSDPMAGFSAPDHVAQRAMREIKIVSLVFIVSLIGVCFLILHLVGAV